MPNGEKKSHLQLLVHALPHHTDHETPAHTECATHTLKHNACKEDPYKDAPRATHKERVRAKKERKYKSTNKKRRNGH